MMFRMSVGWPFWAVLSAATARKGHPTLLVFTAALLLAVSSAHAQTSYPMLMSLKPAAAQIGQTSTHTVNSRYSLLGSYQVLVSGSGVTGEVIPPDIKPEELAKKPNLTSL